MENENTSYEIAFEPETGIVWQEFAEGFLRGVAIGALAGITAAALAAPETVPSR